MTDRQHNTVLYEIYKLIKFAPDKEAIRREVFDLLDEATQKRELLREQEDK